jgi:hypothetical protein
VVRGDGPLPPLRFAIPFHLSLDLLRTPQNVDNLIEIARRKARAWRIKFRQQGEVPRDVEWLVRQLS